MRNRDFITQKVAIDADGVDGFQKTRLLVVGDVMLDRYWFGDTERISPEAPVPIVQIKKIEERLGGAANVARNGASLGAKIAILGLIGHDEAGRQVEKMLSEQAIQSHLQIDETVPTIVKLRVIARQQNILGFHEIRHGAEVRVLYHYGREHCVDVRPVDCVRVEWAGREIVRGPELFNV
jgi:bifunctional ADP-heptose synthase (sugar kinase/adenylyltransferase)